MKVFLEISQNSQENTCARVSFLVKLQAASATLLKKRLWHRCFPVTFVKFLRTPFLQNTSGQVLLKGRESFGTENFVLLQKDFSAVFGVKKSIATTSHLNMYLHIY